MLASSWRAVGLVEKAWQRLDPPTRQELSRLTGIAEPNLSGMNTGRLPMTLESAARIVAAVPGLTVADLGAREEEVAQSDPTVLDRLQRLEDALEKERRDRSRERTALAGRLAVLEAAAGIASPQRTPRTRAGEEES